MDTKTCSRCRETKALAEFYRQAIQSDGRAPHCKACHKSDHPRRSWNKTERGRESARKAARAWYLRNKTKARAHKKLAYEVAMGRVMKPSNCAVCGGAKPLDAHHHDYSKPLDVEWLCRACHRARHATKEAP